jgi:hypothetical protein
MPDQFSMGYALLIGVNENKVASMALPTVARDVTALQEVLVHPQRCAYPEQNVKTITGAEATRAGILEGLDWLQEKIEADTTGHATAVVYFTGHGWRDQSGGGDHYYLIPYDLQEGRIGLSALRAADFAEAIDTLRPRRLLVLLDCCHAGGMGAKSLPLAQGRYTAAALPPHLFMGAEKGVDAPGLSKGLDHLAQGIGRAVISSSRGSQLSYLRRDKTMSIFTYHLIEALTGHAQPQSGAKEVLVSDVMGYVTRKVPTSARLAADADQEPDFQVSGNFPVALILGGKGLGKGEPAPDPLAMPETLRALKQINVGGDLIQGDKVIQGDEVRGNKQTIYGGQYNIGNIHGSQSVAIGPGAQASYTSGLSAAELERLFQPLFQAIQDAPAQNQDAAAETVQKLQQEAARGVHANDQHMARLIDRLIELAPVAVTAVVTAFGQPLLSAIAGPVTSFVISKFQDTDP